MCLGQVWTTVKMQRSLQMVRLPDPRQEVETPTYIKKVCIRDEQDIAEEIAHWSAPSLPSAKVCTLMYNSGQLLV
jgi:hypothetical protein